MTRRVLLDAANGVVRQLFVAIVAVACVCLAAGCNLENVFARRIRSAVPSDDARIDGVDGGQASRVAAPLRVLAGGRENLDDYVVLGIVTGGTTPGWGDPPDYLLELRAAAASLGADTVLDVHIEGLTLTGLAARRRASASPASGAVDGGAS